MPAVAIVARDLIIASRIASAATAAGREVVRVDSPAQLPAAAGIALVFVDWGARQGDWAAELAAWCGRAPETAPPRVILFGPHTDLAAHAAARAAGFGPMLARSKLVASLPSLLEGSGA